MDFPGRSTVLLAIRSGAFKAPEQTASPRVTAFAAPALQSRATGRAFIEQGGGDDIDMTGAEFILTIGRGIGEEAKVPQFRELADAVGAVLGMLAGPLRTPDGCRKAVRWVNPERPRVPASCTSPWAFQAPSSTLQA